MAKKRGRPSKKQADEPMTEAGHAVGAPYMHHPQHATAAVSLPPRVPTAALHQQHAYLAGGGGHHVHDAPMPDAFMPPPAILPQRRAARVAAGKLRGWKDHIEDADEGYDDEDQAADEGGSFAESAVVDDEYGARRASQGFSTRPPRWTDPEVRDARERSILARAARTPCLLRLRTARLRMLRGLTLLSFFPSPRRKNKTGPAAAVHNIPAPAPPRGRQDGHARADQVPPLGHRLLPPPRAPRQAPEEQQLDELRPEGTRVHAPLLEAQGGGQGRGREGRREQGAVDRGGGQEGARAGEEVRAEEVERHRGRAAG